MAEKHKLVGIFCLKCGSNVVDVNDWPNGGTTATVACYNCRHTATIDGFCLGRTHVDTEAYLDAVKDRSWYSPPEEGKRVPPPWQAANRERFKGQEHDAPPFDDEALRGVREAKEAAATTTKTPTLQGVLRLVANEPETPKKPPPESN